jgi:hypothetical protein
MKLMKNITWQLPSSQDYLGLGGKYCNITKQNYQGSN